MNELMEAIEKKMKKTLETLQFEFLKIKAGRANPAILEKITVAYYGTETPINQTAAISVTESRVLTIQPWDISMLQSIEKSIQKSDIGVNPQNDGKCIRLIFPQLTEDKRKEISKEISKLSEDSKISIRNIRREAIDKIKSRKKLNEITEDEVRSGEKKFQNLTDKFCEKIDELCAKKVKEVMSL